jgi:DNA-binding NarL/FixJ family response regulator
VSHLGLGLDQRSSNGQHAPATALERVLVVHRNLLVAEVLARRLAVEPFVAEAVATSDLARAARPSAGGEPWDVVVLDAGARGPQGSWPLSDVTVMPIQPPVLLLGDELDDPLAALLGGARGWIPFDVRTEVLVEAVHAVTLGQLWLPQARYSGVVERLLQASNQRSRLLVLTERQLQVLQALVNGQTTQETALTLFMSPNTVRTHRARLFAKLGVHHALEAVVLAREAGLSPQWPPCEAE